MRRLAVLLVTLVGLTAPAHAGYAIERQTFGGWTTFTWLTDARHFAYCAAQAEFSTGAGMLVSGGAAGLLLSLEVIGQPPPGTPTMHVVLHVDMQWWSDYHAEVFPLRSDAFMLLFRLNWDWEALAALEEGRRLTLLTPSYGFDFPLTGGGPAFARLAACLKDHLQLPPAS